MELKIFSGTDLDSLSKEINEYANGRKFKVNTFASEQVETVDVENNSDGSMTRICQIIPSGFSLPKTTVYYLTVTFKDKKMPNITSGTTTDTARTPFNIPNSFYRISSTTTNDTNPKRYTIAEFKEVAKEGMKIRTNADYLEISDTILEGEITFINPSGCTYKENDFKSELVKAIHWDNKEAWVEIID